MSSNRVRGEHIGDQQDSKEKYCNNSNIAIAI